MTNQTNVPFVFISYSHMDSPQVMPLIDQLKAYGYAVWFDSGIEAGT